MELSVIIPTLNEEKNIGYVLYKIPKQVWEMGEVIVVDSSRDKTPVIAQKFGAKVVRTPPKGKGHAMKIGAQEASGDILVFMDGDRTDPPEYIPLAAGAANEYDVVICARNPDHKRGSYQYRLFSYVYMPPLCRLFREIGFEIRGDPLAGFRAMRKSIWNKLKLRSNNFLIETEMNIKILLLGLSVLEIPIPTLPRGNGILKSKFIRSFDQQMQIIRTLLYLKNSNILPRLSRAKFTFLSEELLNTFNEEERLIIEEALLGRLRAHIFCSKLPTPSGYGGYYGDFLINYINFQGFNQRLKIC
ncbi:MAG: glycosyltransferase family 2 protein [Crenarchaeota archaeon]|nr:glycosyltransferase family 2 protein [Thermoproteota archaeon]MCR8488633.1 glycosyltransferase family 2 protein [Thermoproteota archaeon]